MSKQIVAAYVYVNDLGRPVLRKVRRDPKDFEMQAALYKNDRMYWQRGRGVAEKFQPAWAPKVVYNLPVVLDALRCREPVNLVEGERDADTLASLKKVCATTSPWGLRFTEAHAEWFMLYKARSKINIFMDNDDAGHFAAWQKYTALRGVGVKKKRITIYKPSSPAHKDLTDVALGGLSLSAFAEMEPRAVEETAERYGAARAAAYSDYGKGRAS